MRRIALVALVAACTSTGPDKSDTDPIDTAESSACADQLTARYTADPAAAARGLGLFVNGTIGDPLVPRVGLRNLWAVWGGGPLLNDDVYWPRFRERYGLHEAPWPNDDLPLGLHQVNSTWATVNCLLCHADVVAGELHLGVGNSRIDLQALWDDLVALNAVAGQVGVPAFPLPYTLENRTLAAGVVDGVGLGMQMSLPYGPPGAPIETVFGGQQAAPWWTMRFKDRTYADGAGDTLNHRTMASTLLAFGTTWTELQALEADLRDMHAMLIDTPIPVYPYPIDASLVSAGRAVYQQRCAACHGDRCDPGVPFPDLVVPTATIGTDPLRESAWTASEAAWANASWFGAAGPMRDTNGYQANPLDGVWASAPYLHNGSVPDLASLLDSSLRPAVWRRTGSSADDYDPTTVGWRYTTPAAPANRATVEARRVVDTTIPGLSNAGHDYGDALTADERIALLAYLKTL